MEQNEMKGQAAVQSGEVKDAPPIAPAPVSRTGTMVSPQVGEEKCPSCEVAAGPTAPSYVYAIGKVEPRFPSLAVEKEFAHARKKTLIETCEGLESLPQGIKFSKPLKGKIRYDEERELLIYKGVMAEEERDALEKLSKDKDPKYLQAIENLFRNSQTKTDQEVFEGVLKERENRYLVHKLCWVLRIEGVETYILQPRSSADFGLLVEAIRPAPRSMDIDVVIGVRGHIAPPEMCNGLMVPIVVFDQLYSFDMDSFVDLLLKSITLPEGVTQKNLEDTAWELFNKIVKMADNAGATDEHRALNYLAATYSPIYVETAKAFRDSSLTAVEVRPSRLSGGRKIVTVIFTYTNRKIDVKEKKLVRVDVTEEFPFVVTHMSPYYDL